RKRPGGALDSRPARKRSRLLPSSAAGNSQTEPIDLEESGEDVIDLTGEFSEPEVITISDDESVVDREQSQQHQCVFSAAENSAHLLARDDEDEPRDVDRYAREEVSLSKLLFVIYGKTNFLPSFSQTQILSSQYMLCFFFFQIMQHGQHLMSTMCGHVFCSRCLPIALETALMCPTCRVELSPGLYHPIYL
ncbi:RNF4 ligase, partial [Regulus satrapa]|nr:RNF4 ligase [Regulus satrapa]